MAMLSIKDLHATAGGHDVLKGVDLDIEPGQVHAIMGPNGSGKSTLAHVLSGKPGYEVTKGSVEFLGKDLLALEAEERACEGLFLAFQYPVEIPGVNNTYFLRAAVNAHRKYRGEDEIDSRDFLLSMKNTMKELGMNAKLAQRPVNEGFSGGEKKRNEVLQMSVLEPKLAILDETDSGLDIDALKMVAEGVNRLRSPDRSFLIVTHYQRLLDYIVPDVVHVFANGQVVKTGDKSLALELEEKGYGWIEQASESASKNAEARA